MPEKSPIAVPPGTRTASSVPGHHRWKSMVSCGVLPMGCSLCFPRARWPRVSDHLGENELGRELASSVRHKKVFVSKKKEQDIRKITKGNNMFLEKKKKIAEKRKLQKKA